MTNQPLAVRMRPTTLNEIVGQSHLIGDGKILTEIVRTKTPVSVILYGPPGVGKTSIAHALANDMDLPFEYFNASIHSKKDLQTIAEKGEIGKPVVVLLDEIHRLDKTKQDFLLHSLENGTMIIVGATTENPYIAINPAIRSRTHIFELKPVTKEDIKIRLRQIIEKLNDEISIILQDNELDFLASQTNGDLRSAIGILELAIMTAPESIPQTKEITVDVLKNCIQQRQIGGDKDGDSHYDLLSAFQKSIRGSDVDASLHYLARLIQNGDLVSIGRRLRIIAYEDIGLANPDAVNETLHAVQTAEQVGFPEARIPLAYITVRLALSPKSNVAYKALDSAMRAIMETDRALNIPDYLKDAHYKGASKLGHGVDYQYPHDYPSGIVKQQYLPNDFANDLYLQFRDPYDTQQVQAQYKALTQFLKSTT